MLLLGRNLNQDINPLWSIFETSSLYFFDPYRNSVKCVRFSLRTPFQLQCLYDLVLNSLFK